MSPQDSAPSLPTFADVEDAAKRIAGLAVRTPLLESEALNRRLGGRLLLKAEVLQVTGSFKFRGAYNRVSRIPEADRARGVVAYSSGNHAQGVAAAAYYARCPATIVMPADAPAVKMKGTAFWGAKIVTYDRQKDDRIAIAARIAGETGATIVPPYDDPFIVAGQGTAGLELVEQAAEKRARLDAVLVPCGGGGLVGGIGLAVKANSPATAVYAVEPEGFDDTVRSLATGERQGNRPGAISLADALMAPAPGAITLPVNRRNLAGGFAVSDAAMLAAMATAFRFLKVVIEPGGAAALAAVLSGAFDAKGKVVVVVASGGNVDGPLFARALAEHADTA
jgi:threonine dehydratase